jgi:hypothetical protein
MIVWSSGSVTTPYLLFAQALIAAPCSSRKRSSPLHLD